MATAPKEMRAVYAETLAALAAEDPRIVVVEADLMRATGTGSFAKAFPARAINVGVAEANLIGVASGLSVEGKVPFAATFACFASRRAFDQFFLSANYAGLSVKLVGTDPGVTAGFNGGTHMPFEDLGLMRMIPGLRIVEPSDPVSLAAYVRLAVGTPGCVYLRLQRKAAPERYAGSESFGWGRAKVLREGKDVVIAALGALCVGEALGAASLLEAEGIATTVVDVLCLKPFDAALVLERARACGRLLTVENHQVSGGLGSVAAEAIAEAGLSLRFARHGIKDEFGEVATQDWLQERYGLTARAIAEAARALVTA
jgi:transketolase